MGAARPGPGPPPGPHRLAAPTGLESYKLAPIDRDHETAILTESLRAASPVAVEHVVFSGPCTLTALVAELERGYDVLHLVAHGAITADRTGNVMFLERPDGGVERVDSSRFAQALECLERSLRLVVLMSCNTATRNPQNARHGFAPALLAAGIPAVLAMQDRMPMTTAAAFTRAFYEDLLRHGQVDRAANRARRVVFTEGLPGNAIPALYATRAGLSLWTSPAHAEPDAPPPPTPAPPPATPAPAPEAPTWQEFGGPFAELKVVRAGKCLQAFGRDDDGALLHRHELAPGGAWSEWQEFGAGRTALAVVADARGRVTVFTIDGGGAVARRSADAAGHWSEWVAQGLAAERLAATCRKDGSLVLVTEAEAKLRISEQRSPGGPWYDTYDIDGGYTSILVARNGADHLILLGIDDAGTLWSTCQRRPNSDWDAWSELAENVRGLSTVTGPTGLVNLAAVDPNYQSYWTYESAPGAGWNEWEEEAPDCGELVAVWKADEVLETLAIGSAGTAWRQQWRDEEAGEWEHLGGQRFVHILGVETARGDVEVFTLDEAGGAFRLAPPLGAGKATP